MKTASGRKRRWGQHFLGDEAVAERIVAWAGIDGCKVLEIGPGRGALTGLLAERAASLLLIEIDARLAGGLADRYRDHGQVEVVCGDVLGIELGTLLPPGIHVVANLPYESGTAIVTRLLGDELEVAEMVVMLQKEVAARIAASEGSKVYGVLSIMTQMRADVELGMVVGPQAFRPSPKVESQVVRIRPLSAPRYELGDVDVFRKLVERSFGERRKMLRNSLGRWLEATLGDGRAVEVFAAAEVDPTLRPEAIAIEGFARLGRVITDALARVDTRRP